MKYESVIALLLILALSPLAASASSEEDGKKLIDDAVTKTNIFELPSFQMNANVRIQGQGGPRDGSYLLLWNGPDQWREEINLPGYSEVWVGGKGVVYHKRDADFLPMRVDQLRSTLGYGPGVGRGSFLYPEPRPDERIQRVHERKMGGTKAECIEINDKEKRGREVCVDATSGTLIRGEPFLDKDMKPIGPKVFPSFLSWSEQGKTLAEVRVTDLRPTEHLPPSSFDAPPGTVPVPGCMNPVPGRLVHGENPVYAASDRQAHREGTVVIDMTIGRDGVPHGLMVESGIASAMDAATMDAVKRWRYEPATCSGNAVEIETIVTVNYTLQR